MRRRIQAAPRLELLEGRTLFAITFGSPTDFPVGNSPSSAPALSDFNNDGKIDAAVANTGASGGQQNTVTVLLGNGTGGFGAGTDFPVGQRPYQVLTEDFNGDGKPDLVASNGGDGTVSVLIGRGDGTFDAGQTVAYGTAPVAGAAATASLIAVNVNDDTAVDLVVSDGFDRQIVVLIGAGDGTFTLGQQLPVDPTLSPGDLVFSDFNDDGKPDVVTNIGTTAALAVYFGDGAGAFGPAQTFPVNSTDGVATGAGLSIGDFNNDLFSDVLMVTAPFNATDPSTISVFLSNGNGTFQTSKDQKTPAIPLAFHAAAADFDNDGKTDALVTNGNQFFVIPGNGDGTFAAAADFSSPDTFTSNSPPGFTDLDGDNKTDILINHFGGNSPSSYSMAVFLSGGGGGGGGGGGATSVTPTVSATLPPAVVGGAPAKGVKVAVDVANTGSADFNDSVTINSFVSTDNTVDAGDAALAAPLVKKLKLKPGAHKLIKLKVTGFPSVADGNYFVLAQTSAPGATAASASSTATVNIAAPFVDLSGTLPPPAKPTLTAGKKASISLSLTNAGNVDATGTISVALALRPAGGGADVPLPAASAKLKLKPGTTKATKLSVTPPVGTPAGSYLLVATLDSSNAITESDEANNNVLGATPLTLS